MCRLCYFAFVRADLNYNNCSRWAARRFRAPRSRAARRSPTDLTWLNSQSIATDSCDCERLTACCSTRRLKSPEHLSYREAGVVSNSELSLLEVAASPRVKGLLSTHNNSTTTTIQKALYNHPPPRPSACRLAFFWKFQSTGSTAQRKSANGSQYLVGQDQIFAESMCRSHLRMWCFLTAHHHCT